MYGGYEKAVKKTPAKKTVKKVPAKRMTVQEKLKEHSKHHSPKHMAMMRKLIKEGKSFTVAHNTAKKQVGK